MSRETAFNVLLGTILLLVFAGAFAVCVAVIGFAVQVADLRLKHFVPGLPRFATFLGLLIIFSLVSDVRRLFRKHSWRNAFLSFAADLALLSILFASSHSALGLRGSFWMFGLVLLLSLPTDSPVTRFRFLATTSAICAIVALNTDLVGSGLLARIVTDFVLLGSSVWFVDRVRQNWSTAKNPSPQAPLAPTHA